MSGNETILSNVFVSNPSVFIGAAYTNLDSAVLFEKNVSASFQMTRLEETKSTVARNLFNSHKSVGDEATFYKAFSTYMIQYGRSRQANAVQRRREAISKRDFISALIDIATSDLEYVVTSAFGILTNWGSSASRPLALIIATFLFFIFSYRYGFNLSYREAISNSFDVTSIAGYTRAVPSDASVQFMLASAVNLMVAILFYSVFFSVAVTKISRVR